MPFTQGPYHLHGAGGENYIAIQLCVGPNQPPVKRVFGCFWSIFKTSESRFVATINWKHSVVVLVSNIVAFKNWKNGPDILGVGTTMLLLQASVGEYLPFVW